MTRAQANQVAPIRPLHRAKPQARLPVNRLWVPAGWVQSSIQETKTSVSTPSTRLGSLAGQVTVSAGELVHQGTAWDVARQHQPPASLQQPLREESDQQQPKQHTASIIAVKLSAEMDENCQLKKIFLLFIIFHQNVVCSSSCPVVVKAVKALAKEAPSAIAKFCATTSRESPSLLSGV